MALSNKEIYLMCQPLTDAYIAFSNSKYEVDDLGNKHYSAYNPVYDCITISILQVQHHSKMLNVPESRLFLYILLHEIGHSLDPNIHTEKDVLTLESTAWEIADYLMSKLKLPKTKEYFRVREWALNSHMRKEEVNTSVNN